MKKYPTNEDCFKALFKELDSVEVALLRERVLFAFELTMQSIEQEPEKWRGMFIHPSLYKKLNEKIEWHLGFEHEKAATDGSTAK